MKVLMFGWANSPAENSGLGMACDAIVKALEMAGAQVTLVTPSVKKTTSTRKVPVTTYKKVKSKPPKEAIKTTFKKDITYHAITAKLLPYHVYGERQLDRGQKIVTSNVTNTSFEPASYSHELSIEYTLEQVEAYSLEAIEEIKDQAFDLVYAHDWMSFKAGMLAKETFGLPLITHVHSTEYDRSVMWPLTPIIDAEKEGLEFSDHVITVSNQSADRLVDKYGIDKEKITVIQNTISQKRRVKAKTKPTKGKKYVTFVGRMEYQKGPGYFIDMAMALMTSFPDLLFIMVGEGSLWQELRLRVERSGMAKKILFTGVVSQQKLRKILRQTVLMYQPAINEPYGLAAMEAVGMGIPVVVSKYTGMTETIPSMIKINYWDQYKNKKILSSLLSDKQKLETYGLTCAEEAGENPSFIENGRLLIDVFSRFVF